MIRKLLLKLLGVNEVDPEMIRKYNEAKQQELDISEFFRLENKIEETVRLHKEFLFPLRVYTESDFPVARYRELAYKLNAHDRDIYNDLKNKLRSEEK